MSDKKPSYDTCKKAQDKLAGELTRSGMPSEKAAQKAAEVARKTDAKNGR